MENKTIEDLKKIEGPLIETSLRLNDLCWNFYFKGYKLAEKEMEKENNKIYKNEQFYKEIA